MAIASSTQTITKGISEQTSAGAYNTPASGRDIDSVGTRHVQYWTLTAVTFAASGLIGFSPRANGFDRPIGFVEAWYQPAGSSDDVFVYAGFDPVNTNLIFWNFTDDLLAAATDSPAGQFIVRVTSA